MSKAVEKKIADLIEGKISEAGYELVRVQIMGGGKYATLQVMVDRKDGEGITVDDCAAVSEIVSGLVEVDPDLTERFGLEVSSPGIDRPLVRLKDFEKYVGHLAKIELNEPLNGKRRFQAKIAKVANEEIEFVVDKEPLKVPFTSIERAKLVLTDELMEAAASGKVKA